jgi:hypothetical protein
MLRASRNPLSSHENGKLAAENINITSGYATGRTGSRKTSMVLAVSDLAKAAGIQ